MKSAAADTEAYEDVILDETRLADALAISPDNVSVKGKTNERMGWVGRGEGIAGMAVALIDAVKD